MEYKHLRFTELESSPKTKRFAVESLHDGTQLGVIHWWSRWRCYCFFPDQETVWSWDCLKECSEFIQMLMEARKKRSEITQSKKEDWQEW